MVIVIDTGVSATEAQKRVSYMRLGIDYLEEQD